MLSFHRRHPQVHKPIPTKPTTLSSTDMSHVVVITTDYCSFELKEMKDEIIKCTRPLLHLFLPIVIKCTHAYPHTDKCKNKLYKFPEDEIESVVAKMVRQDYDIVPSLVHCATQFPSILTYTAKVNLACLITDEIVNIVTKINNMPQYRGVEGIIRLSWGFGLTRTGNAGSDYQSCINALLSHYNGASLHHTCDHPDCPVKIFRLYCIRLIESVTPAFFSGIAREIINGL